MVVGHRSQFASSMGSRCEIGHWFTGNVYDLSTEARDFDSFQLISDTIFWHLSCLPDIIDGILVHCHVHLHGRDELLHLS